MQDAIAAGFGAGVLYWEHAGTRSAVRVVKASRENLGWNEFVTELKSDCPKIFEQKKAVTKMKERLKSRLMLFQVVCITPPLF
jgi:hypothetical protein